MAGITFGRAEFSIQFTDRYFRIPAVIIMDPFQLFIRVGIWMFRVRFVGFITQGFFCTVKLFIPSHERGL